MTIIDRPTPVRRATASTSAVAHARRAPLGGRYVSSASPQPAHEGTYTSSGFAMSPNNVSQQERGTYVTTSLRSPRSGGTYTYTG